MSINTLSDRTTRRNRQKIVKEVTNSYTWLNFTGTFKINCYSSWQYNTGFYNSTTQGIGLRDKYIFNRVSSLNSDQWKGYMTVVMIPNDNSAKASYSQLNYWAITTVSSAYLNWSNLSLNYLEWGGNYRCRTIDLSTGTRTTDTARHTTWSQIQNTQVNFLWYQAISDAYVDGSYNNSSWFNVTPYMKLVK